MIDVLQVSFLGMIYLDNRSSAIVGGSYLRSSDGWDPLFGDIGTGASSIILTLIGIRAVFLIDYNYVGDSALFFVVGLCLYCVQLAIPMKPTL